MSKLPPLKPRYTVPTLPADVAQPRKLPPLKPRQPSLDAAQQDLRGTVQAHGAARTAQGPTMLTALSKLVLPPAAYANCPPARVLVIDWPWAFDDATPHKGAEDHYDTLSLDEIKRFPMPPIADNAVLFMWRVGGGNDKGSLGEEAYAVARAHGFVPKSEEVWIKTLPCKRCDGNGWTPIKHPSKEIREACAELRIWCDTCKGRGHKIAIGMGRYVRGAHEVCLIATRGKGMLPADKSIRSIFFAPRREHSSKPDRFYQIVEKLYPEGPYVELFARRRREGWHQFGHELGKLDEAQP